MTTWELVVLGTASQAPTRYRNHNGYLLRAGNEGILFDPGEGTQRQMTFHGVSAAAITRICITHLHGDHCLGLPGVVQRLALDRVVRPIPIYHPASGAPFIDRLRRSSIFEDTTHIVPVPVWAAGEIGRGEHLTVTARPLRHRVDSVGYRIEEDAHLNFDVEALRSLGIAGPDVGRLRREGEIMHAGRRVTLADVSHSTPGRVVAFIMDTAWCDAAIDLARGADLLVCESTFLSERADLAERYKHLTARQAAEIAAAAGARQLLLTHFSQREPDTAKYVADARPVFANVVGAEDGMRVPVAHVRSRPPVQSFPS